MTYLLFLLIYKDLFELKDSVEIYISHNLTLFFPFFFFVKLIFPAESFCGYAKSSDNTKDGAGRMSEKRQTFEPYSKKLGMRVQIRAHTGIDDFCLCTQKAGGPHAGIRSLNGSTRQLLHVLVTYSPIYDGNTLVNHTI